MHAAPFIRMIDKLSFLVGVGSLLATEYIMLRDPSWMPYFFTACVIPVRLRDIFDYCIVVLVIPLIYSIIVSLFL